MINWYISFLVRICQRVQFSFFSESSPCPSRTNFNCFQIFKCPNILPELGGKNNYQFHSTKYWSGHQVSRVFVVPKTLTI